MILIFAFLLICLLCIWATHEAIRDEQMMELAERAARAPEVIVRTVVDNRRLQEAYDAAMRELFEWRHVKMMYETRCDWPPPKVIKVSDRMPSFTLLIGDMRSTVREEIRLHRLVYSFSLPLAIRSEIPYNHLYEQMRHQLREGILQNLTDITSFRTVK